MHDAGSRMPDTLPSRITEASCQFEAEALERQLERAEICLEVKNEVDASVKKLRKILQVAEEDSLTRQGSLGEILSRCLGIQNVLSEIKNRSQSARTGINAATKLDTAVQARYQRLITEKTDLKANIQLLLGELQTAPNKVGLIAHLGRYTDLKASSGSTRHEEDMVRKFSETAKEMAEALSTMVNNLEAHDESR